MKSCEKEDRGEVMAWTLARIVSMPRSRGAETAPANAYPNIFVWHATR